MILGLCFSANSNDQITASEILEEGESLSDYNVKNWGAEGDGQTDDFASLKKAINSQAPSGKVILYFPTGKYKLSQTLKISNPNDSQYSSFKFLIQGAGIKKTEVFVTDKDIDTFYISGNDNNFAQGLFSDLKIGPSRNKTHNGYPLRVKYVEKSVFKNFETQGSRCSVHTSKLGEHASFNFSAGTVGNKIRSNCIGFDQ